MEGLKKNKIFLISIVVLVVLCIAFRIAWVNSKEADTYPEERYSTGEWVELDGAFFNHVSESTRGYAVKVDGASIVSPREYLALEGRGDFDLHDDLDEKSVICVTYKIKNRDNCEGAVLLYLHCLVPDRKNAFYTCDFQLWNAAHPEPEWNDGVCSQGGFRI